MKTLYRLPLIIMAIFTINITIAQVNYENTTITPGNNSSAIGYSTTATGIASFSAGWNSNALGDGSFAFGHSCFSSSTNTIALGKAAQAYRPNSIAIGDHVITGMTSSPFTGSNAICIGNQSIANGDYSMAFGQNVKAGSTNSIVIGEGYSEDQKLNNSTPNSLAIGFNSTQATLFVSGATGGASETGNVGIGTSFPMEKLDVEGKIKASGLRDIVLDNNMGTVNIHGGNGGWANGLKFFGSSGADHGGWRAYGTYNDLNYYFVGTNYQTPLMAIEPTGNLGIGIRYPSSKLHLKDGFMTIDGNSSTWTTSNWDIRFMTPKGSIWRTSNPVSSGDYLGFGMNDNGFHWVKSQEDGNGPKENLMVLNEENELMLGDQIKMYGNQGYIWAKEVSLELINPYPDYVFDKEYQLMEINELEAFIKENKHLPNVPSASKIEKNGLELGESNRLLMEKIEELTLYVIQLKKENMELSQKVKDINEKLQ